VAGKEMRAHPNGSYPVIELAAGTYKNTKYKSIVDVPVFKLIAWDESPWQGAELRRET
jgi:hypothetical protein